MRYLHIAARSIILCTLLLGVSFTDYTSFCAQTPVSIANPQIWANTDLRQYVGQTIRFTTPFYVTNNYNSGSLTISPRRTYSPTNQAIPLSAEYNDILSANRMGEITLTGVSGYHRMGERLVDLVVYVSSTGSVQWKSCTWAGNTRADLEQGYDKDAVNMRGQHTLLVCAMNCEYYLTQAYGSGSSTMGPGNNAEHQKQRAKISAALSKINADIYGLVEVQQGSDAMNEIAADLSRLTGRTFRAIDDGTSVNGTYTKSGYVYCTQTVTPYGALRSTDSYLPTRKKAQVFTENATGERFIFSINHFKSKSGAYNATGDDRDQGDGQGAYNAKRVQEAKAVLASYDRDRLSFHDDDILIMGDLNAYAKEDPITALRDGGMIDLHRAFHADSSYSYTFRGQAGYLDHALCNSTLYPQVTGMVAYHINSDEHDRYTYDSSDDLTMFRCSDHDPILVGLRLDSSTSTRHTEPSLNNYEVFYEGATPCIRNAEGGYYIVYRIDGQIVTQGRIVSVEQYIDDLSQGIYILNIYGQGTCLSTKLIVR